MTLRIEHGFRSDERGQIARLYWGAFGAKLGRSMGPEARALPFLKEVLDPAHAICARNASGDLLGIVGFKTHQGALVDGSLTDMARHYGWPGAIWRGIVLSLLERDTENERFLLDAIGAEARARGYKEVRLDVIDSNPRARALYEREGFVPGGEHRLGLLRHVFGFEAATTMIRRVA